MATPKDYSPFVPFDLYDFFGYLFPGVLLTGSLLIFYWQIEPTSFSAFFSKVMNGPTEMPFVFGLAIVVFGIVALYTIGHFVATLSHVIIDRVLVDGIEGYPYNFLLKMPTPSRPYSEATFKYLFFAFNLIVFCPIVITDLDLLNKTLIGLVCLIVFLVVQRIVIMIIHLANGGRALTAKLGGIWIFKIGLIPSFLIIDPAIEFLRRLLGMDRGFPDPFIKVYKENFQKTFDLMNPDDVGSENYWLSAFHAISHDQLHERTLHMWLQLYGFARNASAAFYLSGALVVGHLFRNPQAYTPFFRVYLLVLFLLATGMGLHYWILYSHYYSKGVFRAFVESTSRPSRG